MPPFAREAQQQDGPLLPQEQRAAGPHSDLYVAALITPLGIRPILDAGDLQAVFMAQEQAKKLNDPAMIFGLSVGTILGDGDDRHLWLFGNGIASPDGLSLFDLRDVTVKAP
ncbi:hypothetical protein FEZ63_22000 [Microvirga brassicacearum]|uniref:Uncharacterized protein n=2 Tax=Microvirga brassicacearum TaxID=2580413 RepID=A0A5N3P4T0_9HYPH|nr:hypothetical protein FEZ63_22000 [Microvirga brassicacearum]